MSRSHTFIANAIIALVCLSSCSTAFARRNKKKPAVTFDFKPGLTIGRENCPKNDFFRRIEDVKVDSKGNIYILDNYSCRIWKFDSTGDYLFSFGKEGSGKRQFESPTCLIIDSKDNLYVLDGRLKRVSVFDSNGKFLRSFNVDLQLAQFDMKGVLGSGDRLILRGYNDGKVFHVYDTLGNYISSFGEPAHPFDASRYAGHEVFLALGTTFCSNGLLLSTNPFNYGIREYDASTGKLIGTITRSFPQWNEPVLHLMPQGSAALDGAYPGCIGVTSTLELKHGQIVNFLCVSRGPGIPITDYYMDIFTKSGDWLGLYDVNYWASCIDKYGRLYCIPCKEPGVWKVVRCTIKIIERDKKRGR